MNLIKKLLLTIIYPFWFLLGQTWFGNVTLLVSVPFIPAGLMAVCFPKLMMGDVNVVEDIAAGVAIISVLCSFPIAGCLITLGDYLVDNYRRYGYKLEMSTKMP